MTSARAQSEGLIRYHSSPLGEARVPTSKTHQPLSNHPAHRLCRPSDEITGAIDAHVVSYVGVGRVAMMLIHRRRGGQLNL